MSSGGVREQAVTPVPPVLQEVGIKFVSYLSSLGRAHSTIKKKLTGIHFHHRQHGLADPFADAPALDYHLRGLKKLSGASRGKMPATKDLYTRTC